MSNASPNAAAGTRTGNGSKLGGIFRSLRHRNFRLFFMGQGISLLGSWMQMAAGGWLAYMLTTGLDDRTRDWWLGVVGFCGRIPTLLLAPFVGVLIDRWSRHRTVIVTQAMAMVQALVLAAITLAGWITLGGYIALALLLGLINSFDIPARQSFMIQMIDQPEDLNNAIALNSSLVNASRIVGPSLATVLLATVGAGFAFLLNGLSYIAVIAALLMMTVRPQVMPKSPGPMLANLREGMRYVFGFAPIRSILLLLAVVSLTGASYQALLPGFAGHVLGAGSGAEGSKVYGLLLACGGAGALTGAIFLARRESVIGLGRWLAIAPAIMGAGLIGLGLSRVVWLSAMVMPIVGFGMLVQMASCNTILQTIVDDDKRGRVMSFYSMAFMGMMPVGSLLGGAVARQIGAAWTVVISGACCIVGAMVFSRKLPEIRRLIRPIYIRKGIIIPEVATGLQAASDPAGPAAGDLTQADSSARFAVNDQKTP